MREIGIPFSRDADALHHLPCQPPRFLFADILVQVNDLGDLLADCIHRVERGHWILKDHGDLLAAHLPHLLFAVLEQILSLEQDRSRRNFSGRLRDQVQQTHRDRGFSGPRLADQPEHLALLDLKAYTVYRVTGADLPVGICDRKILDRKQRLVCLF